MAYPQAYNMAEGQTDAPIVQHDNHNMMAQNINNDLMRQMQHQFSSQQRNPGTQNTNGLGTLQNGLGNLNPNVLMNAFQAPQGQNGQQGGRLDVQRAENILVAALAAAGDNPQNQNSGSTGQTAQAPGQTLQPTNAFGGFEGLEQLQSLNPLQHAAANQPNGNSFPMQNLGGLQGLQQQLTSLQQQVQQPYPGAQSQQPNLQQIQQPGPNQNQPQNQQGFPGWMGQNMTNPGMNPAAFSLSAWGGAGDGGMNGNFQQELHGQNQMQTSAHQIFQNGAPGHFPQQMQMQLPPEHRASSLSSGSLSPIGNRKSMNSHDGGLGGRFPPNLSTSSCHEQPSTQRKEKKKRAKNFPEKLLQAMMEYADEAAVAWLPDGKSFVIVNPDLFCEEVLSKVFKESKYASFVRKLHRWGFIRLTSGTGTDCFHHPMFQRDRKELCAKIACAPRGDKDKDNKSSDRANQPPSLAGVERFIRAKVVAAAASAAAQAEESMLLKSGEGEVSENGL